MRPVNNYTVQPNNQFNSVEYEKASQSTVNAPRFLEVRTKLRVRPL